MGMKLGKRTCGVTRCRWTSPRFTGVTTSVCQNNYDDLVNEDWVDELVRRGVHYVWYATYMNRS